MVLDDSVMRRSDELKEMMRLARSILADGHVSRGEALAFQAWIEANPGVLGIPRVAQLVGVLRNVLDDGRLTAQERKQLARALDEFGGS